MPGLVRLTLTSLCFLLANEAFAQEHSYAQQIVDAKYQLSAGIFYPERRFRIQVNGSGTIPNGEIQVEEELKLSDRDQTFAAEATWKFSERWRLQLQYFEVSDSVSYVLEEDIEWEDIVFQAGSNVSGGAGFSTVRLFFGWQFPSEPQHNFGVGFGIHQLEISAFLSGEAITPGAGSEFRSESVRTNAPLPSIGFWYNRVLASRWAFTSRMDWLRASIDPYDGAIANAAVGISYAISKNFGVGLNYNYFRFDAGITDDDWRGHVDLRYHGPYISIDAFW